jgi:hypothetical protein
MSPTLAALAIDQEAAQQAYDDGDWPRAAQCWRAIATSTEGYTASRAFYEAARAHARNGTSDDAFVMLGAALSALALPPDELEDSRELEALRADPRWPALRARTGAVFASWEATLGQPALRRELLELRREDQAVRLDPTRHTLEGFLAVDTKTSARLGEIIAAHGWPGIALVGHDGAAAAWLIAQHATHDRAFQEACLARLEQAVACGQAEARHVAYLEDRLATMAGRPQRYGTQFSAELEPLPIVDAVEVDARRRSVGMCSMSANTQRIRKQYNR